MSLQSSLDVSLVRSLMQREYKEAMRHAPDLQVRTMPSRWAGGVTGWGCTRHNVGEGSDGGGV